MRRVSLELLRASSDPEAAALLGQALSRRPPEAPRKPRGVRP